MLHIKSFFFNPLQTRCCVVWKSGPCAIIDPGAFDAGERDELTGFIEENGLKPEKILLTHGHFDHVFGVKALVERYGVPVYMRTADRMAASGYAGFSKRLDGGFAHVDMQEGEVIRIGTDIALQVIETPGHTPGGVCLYDAEDGVLFSGDTLFAGTIGRTDLPGGDYDQLMKSILDKLMTLPGEVEVIPGHGPETTLGREAMTNPFLLPFNGAEPDWTQEGISLERGEEERD